MRDWLGSGGRGGGERAKQEWLRSSGGGGERERQQRLGIALSSAAGKANAADERQEGNVVPLEAEVSLTGPEEAEDGGPGLRGSSQPAPKSRTAASRSAAKPFAVWQLHDGEWHRLSPGDGSWVRVAGGPMGSHPAPTGPATQPPYFTLLPHSSGIGSPLPTPPGPSPTRSPQPAAADTPLLTPAPRQQGAPSPQKRQDELAEAESIRVEGIKAAAIAAAVTAVAAPVAAGVVVQVRDSSVIPTLCRHGSPIHTFR